MTVVEEKNKQDKRKRIITIIALLILLVAIIIGAVFFFCWLANRGKEQTPDNTPEEEEVIDNTESIQRYDRLLKLLNDEASANHYTAATELVSFHYDEAHKFYITGKNDTKVYDYSIDLTSVGFPTLEESLDYLLENDPSITTPKVFDNLNLLEAPESFTTKYVNDNIKHKSVSVTMGTKTYITSTMYESQTKKVFVIHQEELDTVLSSTYTPIEISKEQDSYPLYRYIAKK